MADKSETIFLEELKGFSPCTDEEMKLLIPKAFKGDEKALSRLVEGNMQLAAEEAKFFAGEKIGFMDLVQEGSMSLFLFFKEEECFKNDTEDRLKAAVKESMEAFYEEENNETKAGEELRDKLNLIDALCVKIAEEKGREATAEEVAELLKMEPEDVKYLIRIALSAVKKEK